MARVETPAEGCFVLTGAHGVGKSSLARALEYDGERVTPEAGQDVRMLLESAGEPFPLDRDDFESQCLRLQRLREQRARVSGGRVFLDRGAPDYLAYAELGPWRLTGDERTYCLESRYDAVFLVQPHGDGWGSTLRPGERAFCERLVVELRKVYRALGMTIYDVPPGGVWERAGWVLAQCAGYGSGQPTARRAATSAQRAGM